MDDLEKELNGDTNKPVGFRIPMPYKTDVGTIRDSMFNVEQNKTPMANKLKEDDEKKANEDLISSKIEAHIRAIEQLEKMRGVK